MLANLVLAFVSAALSLSLMEVGARTFLPKPSRPAARGAEWQTSGVNDPDPELGWRLGIEAARWRDVQRSEDGQRVIRDVTYTIGNAERVTSRASRGEDAPAVIVAGCSFTFGDGLNDEETWPWLLQEALPQYRVINIGTMAYGTDQALMAAERKETESAAPAQAVVLGFGDFQIERDRAEQQWLSTIYPFSRPLFVPRRQGVKWYGLVRFLSLGEVLDQSDALLHVANRVANYLHPVPSHAEAREMAVRMMLDYRDRLRRRGRGFAVLMLPYKGDTRPQAIEDRAFVSSRLAAAGVPTLSMAVPRRADGRVDVDHVLLEDGHPNRNYNRLLVQQAVPFLRERVLGP